MTSTTAIAIKYLDKMSAAKAVAQLMGSYSSDSGSSSDDESQSSASSAGQQAGSDNLSQQNDVAVAPPEQQNENVPPQNNMPPRPVLNEQQEQELHDAVEAFVPSVGLSDAEARRERNVFRNEYRLFLLGLLSSKPSAVRYVHVYSFKVYYIVYI